MGFLKPQSNLDKAFDIAILLKGLDGILELLGGLILLVVSPKMIVTLVGILTQHELSTDPHDFIATHLLHASSQLSSSTELFGSIYLLLHGVVKVILVIALLLNKLWAYPAMIAFLIIFIFYQIYRIALDHSILLVLLTVFDALVVWLTYKEYTKRRAL